MLALSPTFQKESLTITLAEGSAIPLPGTYPKQLRTSAHIHADSSPIHNTRRWSQSKRSLTDERTNKLWCVYIYTYTKGYILDDSTFMNYLEYINPERQNEDCWISGGEKILKNCSIGKRIYFGMMEMF